ncbi:MAG: mechanosensitive ion channel family protein [Catonella sp.]|uniref:mechanosensitive ion channel family protein n=1 Tax=Catonella sp. TaxID=2382125 RepID=UPI003FA08E1E
MDRFEKMFDMPVEKALLFAVKPILILIVCKIVVGIVLKVLDKVFEKSKLDTGIKGFFKQIVRIALYIIGIIMAAQSLEIDTSSLVTLLGVASLAFSLSLQNILTNVFSGIMLLITKPFVTGDYIEVSGISGTVTAISLMRTRIRTADNKVELIPNSDVASQRISNYSGETRRRVDITVSADYKASTKEVISAIQGVIDNDERVVKEEGYMPTVRLSKFNADDISYVVKVWCENGVYWDVYYDLLENIREAYAKNGIEFSYPHRVVHIEK